jgi:hypothetical protein
VSSHSKLPLTGQEITAGLRRAADYRTLRQRECAKRLPPRVYSEQYGWGIVVKIKPARADKVRPPERRRLPPWAVEHRSWYMVMYGSGVECHTLIPGEGDSLFFTWEEIWDEVRYHERQVARASGVIRPRPVWRLIYRMWG